MTETDTTHEMVDGVTGDAGTDPVEGPPAPPPLTDEELNPPPRPRRWPRISGSTLATIGIVVVLPSLSLPSWAWSAIIGVVLFFLFVASSLWIEADTRLIEYTTNVGRYQEAMKPWRESHDLVLAEARRLRAVLDDLGDKAQSVIEADIRLREEKVRIGRLVTQAENYKAVTQARKALFRLRATHILIEEAKLDPAVVKHLLDKIEEEAA